MVGRAVDVGLHSLMEVLLVRDWVQLVCCGCGVGCSWCAVDPSLGALWCCGCGVRCNWCAVDVWLGVVGVLLMWSGVQLVCCGCGVGCSWCAVDVGWEQYVAFAATIEADLLWE